MVRVYELNAADIVHNLPNRHTRNSKDFPDLIIKTFETANGGTEMPACREVGALRWLNKLGCKHAPTLLRTFKIKKQHHKIHVVVMKKIEGVTLSDCYDYEMTGEEQRKVQRAFDVAIRAVAKCQIYNGSPALRNLMYSAEDDRCYIIDYERTEFGDVAIFRMELGLWGLF
ncbi:hypothetical protein LTR37_013636 [Vermiconidia calcicola]|uniref:Uncharacterized protein n=1 Tax=Vermiconidia calcicola TaxID=1690605 RepID=A0ACC3MXC7_9PEZI|nr:hypothetical protein LTR37_013636 [Vermiconidia calcicola]